MEIAKSIRAEKERERLMLENVSPEAEYSNAHLRKIANELKEKKIDLGQLIKNFDLDHIDKHFSGGEEMEEPQIAHTKAEGLTDPFLRDDFTCPGHCTHPASAAPVEPINPAFDPAVINKLVAVLSKHFTNGYRLNSHIEMVRFRSFAAELYGEEIELPPEELKRFLAICGTVHGGKVYAVSTATKERIKKLAQDYFSEGAKVIFFAEFYAKNEDWLFGASVISQDMLIGILRHLFPNLSFTKTYFGYTNAPIFVVIESEILRVWGDNVLQTYDQLAERLNYVPIERIKYHLGQNGNFIWSSAGTFSHVSRIEITDEERQEIRAFALRECNAHGYASMIDLPFGEIEGRNHDLSSTAVHSAVYRICLSDKFENRGKILTHKGVGFDALTIMKKYCRRIDRCTTEDLLNLYRELTGREDSQVAMAVGTAVLVRVDRDTYMADRYLHFTIDLIDQVIGQFLTDEYLPLKDFTTFATFPHCGHTWNLFLLESYCRRFSREFRFDTPTINSRNTGVVIRKSCDMDHTEILIDAVVNSNVPLTIKSVGAFLFESGYIGKSTPAKVAEIINKAKVKREGRD
ncbi:MAG: hypothetical protein JKP90_01900 [Desulfofustis sp. PB-SRB1]|nr:hypothetical protein [Desulfofustis sp. PB-SRB1]